jgi:hypothetical protein
MTPLRALACAVAAALPCAASAVYLNPDGLGQALIFPYYTVQSNGSDWFNTYVSVVNHTAHAKALRVRVREARNSREVASFNLYLSPNDVWTGAVLPSFTSDVVRLVTADRSCTLPAATLTGGNAPGFTFQNTLYAGAFDDGLGSGLDRTREGWIEVIEMAGLTGAAATAMTHNAAGIPANCAAIQAASANDIAVPTGGLSGTLTLINVASGMDFTVNADALADLSTRSFFRPASDAYPDLNAVEIDPVSVVVANGSVYRSTWNRAADAVSAVLLRSEALAEYVLDAGTQSNSAVMLAFPTRQFYVNAASGAAPFSRPAAWSPGCAQGGEPAAYESFDREERRTSLLPSPGLPAVAPAICAASLAIDVRNGSAHMPTGVTGFLGSTGGFSGIAVLVGSDFQNGWLQIKPTAGTLTSLGTSTRTSVATGLTTTGAHVYSGLPMVGLSVRTFVNGTLTCGAGSCQGNYGGSFPLKFRRSITPSG